MDKCFQSLNPILMMILRHKKISAGAGIEIDDIISAKRIVNWQNNIDVQNEMKNTIEE